MQNLARTARSRARNDLSARSGACHRAGMAACTLDDFERLAAETMAPAPFGYVAGGAGDEVTLRENLAAFRRWRLRPRVLVDVATVDLATTLLGTPIAMPVGLAPTARQRLAHPEGERAVARAASAAG